MRASETRAIGEVAAAFGVGTHVLRHWESEGLLEPARDSAGQRRYARADEERVAAILLAKAAGLSLDAVRTIITGDRSERRDVLSEKRRELEERIATARSALRLVEGGLACEHDRFADCPHFRDEIGKRLDRRSG